MSIQRDIVSRMTGELSERYRDCGILVMGSVQRGEERPDSDIDLFVVFEGDGRLGLTHETSPEGVKIDLALFPKATFLRQFEDEWFLYWGFSRATIVHDPTGVAAHCQDLVRRRFKKNPHIDAAWEQQQAEVLKHKADRTYTLAFPQWSDFASHVRRIADPDSAEDR